MAAFWFAQRQPVRFHVHEKLTNTRHPVDLSTVVLRIKCELAAHEVLNQLRRMSALVAKAFNPSQVRIPAGESGGGRWGDGGTVQPTGANGRQSVRVGRGLDATPAQAARLAMANARADAAMAQVRERDPTWRPRDSLTAPNSVEGAIRQSEAQTRDAEARLAQLDRLGMSGNGGPALGTERPLAEPTPRDAINAYRGINGTPVIGVNSNANGYTAEDEAAAKEIRGRLIDKYPATMNTDNPGRKPNDVVTHAETTALTRAAKENGGTLSGRQLDVVTDREMCRSCQSTLPLVGPELGNPTVRFTEPNGDVWIMRDGIWITRGRP
jgi:hypothetical protein